MKKSNTNFTPISKPTAELTPLYVDERALSTLQLDIKREVTILQSVFEVWPNSLPKPESLEALSKLFANPIPDLSVKKYKLESNPIFKSWGLSVDANAKTVELTHDESILANMINRYGSRTHFFQQEYYTYSQCEGVKIVPDLQEKLQAKFTVYAKNETVVKLKKALEDIANAINKAGIPTVGLNPYQNFNELLSLDISEGKLVAIPYLEGLNRISLD